MIPVTIRVLESYLRNMERLKDEKRKDSLSTITATRPVATIAPHASASSPRPRPTLLSLLPPTRLAHGASIQLLMHSLHLQRRSTAQRDRFLRIP